MIKRFSLLASLAAAVASLVLAAVSSAAATPKLMGTVGPGFTITLKDSNGMKVTKLKAGKYTFVVTDKSSIHNFELEKGSTHKLITGVGFVGKKTMTVTLTKGKWLYVCEPHERGMRGAFTVT